MSLVPTWVLAQDGKYYKDPILRGKDWFLCFDDDDPPELVIKAWKVVAGETQRRKCGAYRKYANDLLTGMGFPFSFISGPHYSGRCFTSDIGESAGAFFVKIDGPIPVPQKFDDVGDFEKAVSRDCVVYDFNRHQWPKKKRKRNVR